MEEDGGGMHGCRGLAAVQGWDGRSDVGDGTFAGLLHGDLHVRGGHVALLTALLPGPRPAVALVLLDYVQHLEPIR